MEIRFDDQTAIVTGAGNGLGRDYAIFLAQRGARVVVNDFGGATDGSGHSESPAQIVADEITAAGGAAKANFDDVSNAAGAENIVKTALNNFGSADILICNAGILRDKSFAKMPLEDFETVVRVHLLGSFYVAKFAFPAMREKNYGRILLTTSAAGLYGNFGQTNYAAAKLGIVGLMNSLKLEVGKHNIFVNTIAPLALTRLGGVFPDALAPVLRVDLITPFAAFLCSENCQTSGDIFAAGAGHFAKAQIVQAAGARFDIGETITPEMIAARFDEIVNMDGAAAFDKSQDAFLATIAPFVESQNRLR